MTTPYDSQLDRLWAAINDRDLDTAMAQYAPDATAELAGSVSNGRAEIRAELEDFIGAFPDITYRVKQRVAAAQDGPDGTDHVFEEWEAVGSHGGPFLGHAATGKPIRIAAATIYAFSEGLIVSDRTYLDLSRTLLATGVLRRSDTPEEVSPRDAR